MALLTKIKTRVTLHARRRVSTLLDGQYASSMTGRSLDFNDLRAYVPGDDVADIDWPATARHGELMVKRYVADRKHTVMLVVDTGRELGALASWGPEGGHRVDEIAVLAAGAIGWIAIAHGDRVGLICSTEEGPTAFRPSSRELDLERMLAAVEAHSGPTSAPQRTAELLEHAAAVLRRRSIMVVVTGDVALDAALEERLRRLCVRHEVILITVADVDPTAPLASGHRVRDVSSGRRLAAFAGAGRSRSELASALANADAQRAAERRDVALRLGIAHLHLRDLDGTVPALLTLLEGMRRAR